MAEEQAWSSLSAALALERTWKVRSVLDHIGAVDLVESLAKFRGLSGIRALANHRFQDWREKTPIFCELCVVVRNERSLDSSPSSRRDQFHAAHKNALHTGRLRFDCEGQNPVNKGAGDDVNQSGAFFKPGIFPGFEH